MASSRLICNKKCIGNDTKSVALKMFPGKVSRPGFKPAQTRLHNETLYPLFHIRPHFTKIVNPSCYMSRKLLKILLNFQFLSM